MSKKDRVNVKKNNDNKKYRLNILISLLTVILVVWTCLLVFKYNQYNDVNKKIDKILEYENRIKYLNDNYAVIEDVVNKINDVKNDNDIVNKDIDKITKDIEDLHYKISKYRK